jgi:hypothetical protein
VPEHGLWIVLAVLQLLQRRVDDALRIDAEPGENRFHL